MIRVSSLSSPSGCGYSESPLSTGTSPSFSISFTADKARKSIVYNKINNLENLNKFVHNLLSTYPIFLSDEDISKSLTSYLIRSEEKTTQAFLIVDPKSLWKFLHSVSAKNYNKTLAVLLNLHPFSRLFLESSEEFLGRTLYDAVYNGNVSAVQSILKYPNVNPNYMIPEVGMNGFHLAVDLIYRLNWGKLSNKDLKVPLDCRVQCFKTFLVHPKLDVLKVLSAPHKGKGYTCLVYGFRDISLKNFFLDFFHEKFKFSVKNLFSILKNYAVNINDALCQLDSSKFIELPINAFEKSSYVKLNLANKNIFPEKLEIRYASMILSHGNCPNFDEIENVFIVGRLSENNKILNFDLFEFKHFMNYLETGNNEYPGTNQVMTTLENFDSSQASPFLIHNKAFG